MRDAPLPPALAAGLVFLASGAVLVLEILGIRLLAPYVGLTLETTTTIIGTVLAGIAAGAAAGGRAADRMDARRLIPELLIAGTLLAVGVVPVVRTLGPAASGGGDGAALTLALVVLFPAAAVLSAVTPAVAKLQVRDLAATGSVVGRLSAWATAGALAGTFGTGFVVVPLLPTDVAVFAVGGMLLAAGIATALRARLRTRRAAAGIAAAAVLVGAATLAAGSPCDAESTYHCARVLADPAHPAARILVLDDLRHSAVDLRDPRVLGFAYTRWIGDAIDGMAPPAPPSTRSSSAAAGSRSRAISRPRGRDRARGCSRWTVRSWISRASAWACAPGRRCASAPATRASRCATSPPPRPTSWSATRSAGARSPGTSPRGSSRPMSGASCGRAASTRST